jgi:hypothetical protein
MALPLPSEASFKRRWFINDLLGPIFKLRAFLRPPRCPDCGQQYRQAPTCTNAHPNVYVYGTEPKWAELRITPADQCRDCGVQITGHHHPGCCVADCIVCVDQALICSCRYA